jgi:hypothetical protein
LEDLDMDVSVILKFIVRKYDLGVWIGLIRLMMRVGGEL